MKNHVFAGFGFGPIQAGLFVHEAFQSGNFARMVISEIDAKLVAAVRANGGSYYVNIARADRIEVVRIDGIEIYNPQEEKDRKILLEVLSQASEMVTSLPSVSFYDAGQNSVASLMAAGLQSSRKRSVLIYTAENHNHAAEILEEQIQKKITTKPAVQYQFLNTVIGKMSQVVTDSREIAQKNLKPLAAGIERAFLVEEFNKILVTQCRLGDFRPGIEVFLEKEDLLPFEEAKLYGHNAIHALLAYLGAWKGYTKMAELKGVGKIMKIARQAFLGESGAALVKKHAGLQDVLFTEPGYREYAEDLLQRMTNPFLDDTIERAGRDPRRKLGVQDRLFGTMQVVWQQGVEPQNMALGTAAALVYLLRRGKENQVPEKLLPGPGDPMAEFEVEEVLRWLWQTDRLEPYGPLVQYVKAAREKLMPLLAR